MRHPSDPTRGRMGTRAHERALEALARRGRLRALSPSAGIDFTSNDYLGLAASGELAAAAMAAIERGVPVGAGGSRLLRGNHPEHEALEAEAAAFFGSEAALYFGSGFGANAALIATLPARGDLIVHDAHIHASAWDGMAGTKAETRSARHNELADFEAIIREWRGQAGRAGRVWIAVESLYSMDGDVAPLADLAVVADRYDAMLLIDEAHATGVLGPGGRGLAAAAGLEGRANVVALHTCGKALGASGALITCERTICDFLVNRARAFIYATAPSPVMAAVVRRALGIMRDEPDRRERLAARVAAANAMVAEATGCGGSGSQVVPVIVGGDGRAVALAAAMQARGYDIRAIRPPTVPEGTARVRITVTLNVGEDVTGEMMGALGEELAALGDGAVSASGDGASPAPRRRDTLRTARVLIGEPIAASPHNKKSEVWRGSLQRSARLASLAPEREMASPEARLIPSRTIGDGSLMDPHPGPPHTGEGEARLHRDGKGEGRLLSPRFVVTGTGTGVGKTVFAAALVQALGADYWKPIQAGIEDGTDTERVKALTGLSAEHFHAEAYRLRLAASPHLAAEREGVEIEAYRLEVPEAERALVIEGAGGVMVPLSRETLLIDVLARWQVPVILVAATELGTINHSLLSIEALKARGVPIHGVAFVGAGNASSEAMIVARSGVRRLGRLEWMGEVTREGLAAAFAEGFDVEDFAGLAS